jgi:hypothetical protein
MDDVVAIPTPVAVSHDLCRLLLGQVHGALSHVEDLHRASSPLDSRVGQAQKLATMKAALHDLCHGVRNATKQTRRLGEVAEANDEGADPLVDSVDDGLHAKDGAVACATHVEHTWHCRNVRDLPILNANLHLPLDLTNHVVAHRQRILHHGYASPPRLCKVRLDDTKRVDPAASPARTIAN